jgi:glycosyltransferase involved in cell wall biosynthesis
MTRTKYLLVTTHFGPDFHYGGVVESSVRLYKYLLQLADVRLSTVSRTPKSVRGIIGIRGKCYKSILFHGFAISLDAIVGICRDVRSADVVLINGIFTFPVTLAQLYAVVFRKPFIVAPRGGLQPWRVAHRKWKKYLYIKLITLPLMRRARVIHVTSDIEEKAIRAFGFNNVVNIGNGIDLEMYNDLPDRYSYGDCRDGRFIFLFMSRTDKEKGIDILVGAYRELREKYATGDFLLLVVGPDDRGYLKHFDLDYDRENITRMDGVYEYEKIKLIRRADVVVLPSYSESFGNVVAESLACERPVITTTGTPWQAIERIGCGFCIPPEREPLFLAMEQAYLLGRDKLEQMGRLGRTYVSENFSWKDKARDLFACLERLS